MMQQNGAVPLDSEIVEDAYSRNRQVAAASSGTGSDGTQLEDEVVRLKEQMGALRKIADEASGAKLKLKKERDYHRLNHRRIAQEKNKLIGEIARCGGVCECSMQ